MSDLDDWVLLPASHWLKYLTKDEVKKLADRTGGCLTTHFDSFSDCLWTRFKYLYNPLTEEEWNYWKAVTERVEKQIEEENGK